MGGRHPSIIDGHFYTLEVEFKEQDEESKEKDEE